MGFQVFKEEDKDEKSLAESKPTSSSTALQGRSRVHSVDSSLENTAGSLSIQVSTNFKLDYCKKIDVFDDIHSKTSILNEEEQPKEVQKKKSLLSKTLPENLVPSKENKDDSTISSLIGNAKSTSSHVNKERSLSPSKRQIESFSSLNFNDSFKKSDSKVVVNPNNKENWDSMKNAYSTDRKPKKHRFSSLKKDGRVPLADITSSYHKRILKIVTTDTVDQNNKDIYTTSKNPDQSSKFTFSLKNFQEKQVASESAKKKSISPDSLASISNEKLSLDDDAKMKNAPAPAKTGEAKSGEKKSKVLMMR